MTMPDQRPGWSKQDYATPNEFIVAVKHRLGISEFSFDFAADATNTKAEQWWGIEDDALSFSPDIWAAKSHKGWCWLNPPFSDIAPWAKHCSETAMWGGQVALLVPASVGSNWFRDYVDGEAKVLLLNGRIPFMPDKPKWLYPKDCILCLFSSYEEPGYEVWDWRKELT